MCILAVLINSFIYGQSNIDKVLNSIEQNNTTLKLLNAKLNAQRLQNSTFKNLAGLEIEFNYLWDQFLNLHIIRSKYLSLCLLSNLAWFYLFLNKQNYQIARGIIGGTLFYIPYILYVNYIY